MLLTALTAAHTMPQLFLLPMLTLTNNLNVSKIGANDKQATTNTTFGRNLGNAYTFCQINYATRIQMASWLAQGVHNGIHQLLFFLPLENPIFLLLSHFMNPVEGNCYKNHRYHKIIV